MKIDKIGAYNSINRKQDTKIDWGEYSSIKTGRRDHVDFSSNAKSFAVAMSAAKDALSGANEIRSEKVNAISEQISSGAYQINSGQVANKILQGITA